MDDGFIDGDDDADDSAAAAGSKQIESFHEEEL